MKNSIATRIVAVVLTSLLMVGCTATQVTTTLEAVVDAASIAAPIVTNLAGLSPDVRSSISAYLGAVDTAVAQAGAELNSPDSNAVKSVKIVSYFTDAGLQLGPSLPAGTPTLVLQVTGAVARSIANFLMQFQAPTTAALKGSKINISVDQKALARILEKNHKNALTLGRK